MNNVGGESRSISPVAMSMAAEAQLLQSRLLDAPSHPGVLGKIDRYEILQVLGRGGMGIVFLARDTERNAQVAIKVLVPELVHEPRAVHRFLVEARHMQRLAHPRIVSILDVSDRPEGPYIVLPYMTDGSLAKEIAAGTAMATDQVILIASDIAEALSYAHAKGIIHRDLKPSNVLLDAGGRAYLSDFGLVRTVFNDSLVDVRRNQTEGTPAYMAPEIARGEAGDTRCDIYSFGAMLYEMLTGDPPYEGPSQESILQQVRTRSPIPISQRQPQPHPALAQLTEMAMARELRDRYASMADVCTDLALISQGKPLRPIPNRRWQRSKAWRRFLLIAVCLAVLFALLALTPWDEAIYRRLVAPTSQ